MLLSLLPLFAITSHASSIIPRDTPLINCLKTGTGITVVAPGTPAFSTASKAFNRRLSYTPAAIVYPNSPSAVSYAVSCAASNKIPIAARSGGHSYAAYGLGGQNGALVVDLKNLTTITLDTTTGLAVSQTGNTLGSLATALYLKGNRALPHGTCPYVGTGGHTSFGGFGFYSRKAGLLLDRVTAAQVVLANGTIVTASSASNSDLFWAVRGAAPSFGIVTSWTFSTLPAPSQTVNFKIDFFDTLSKSALTSAMTAFQAWVTTGVPDELGMSVVLGPSGDGQGSGLYLEFQGSFYGTQTALNSALAALLNTLPKSRYLTTSVATDWKQGLEYWDGPLDTSGADEYDNFFAKSIMTSTSLSNTTWANWINYLTSDGVSTDLDWFAEIDLYGGAISRVANTATAFVNRNAQLTFQLYASAPDLNSPYPSSGITFVNGMTSAITTNPTAAYPNYVDPNLTSDQWHAQYYGANYARLSQIRKVYDPNFVFKAPQSIQ